MTDGEPTVVGGLPRIPGVVLGEEIGRGGFATVYRGHQLSVNRDVAVKIDDRRLVDARDRRRFTREIIAAGAVAAHPHIVTLYDGGTTADDHPYLVMELYPGGSYSDRMRRDGPVPVSEVLDVGFAIADALVAAHGEGILHRDVKPGNILISRYGSPALTDFGLAALPPAAEGYSVTMDSLTPSYAAPEAFGGDEPTAAMDIYALGASLYAMLIGRTPRSDSSGSSPPIAKLLMMLNEPLPDPGVPGSELLMQVIWRATAVEPGDRYPTAAALRDGLAAARAGNRSGIDGLRPTGPTRLAAPTSWPTGPGPTTRGVDPSERSAGMPELLAGTLRPEPAPAPRRRGLLTGLTVLVVTVLAAGGVLVAALRGSSTAGQPIIVGNPISTSATPSRSTPPSTTTTAPPTTTTSPTSTSVSRTTSSTSTTSVSSTQPLTPPAVGTCFGGIYQANERVSASAVRSCQEPHAWEAYATGLLDPKTETSYITDVAKDPVVVKVCTKEALQRYLGPSVSGVFRVRVIPPTEVAFLQGKRGFYCVVSEEGKGTVTGSLKAGR